MYNLSSEDVSKELHKSSIAFLPFPTGVGDKRGSALACLKHDLALITIHSGLTPNWWKESTYHADNSEKSVTTIQAISAGNIAKTPAPKLLKKAMDEREWDNISCAHMSLYTVVDQK
jgi:hypothetical protein